MMKSLCRSAQSQAVAGWLRGRGVALIACAILTVPMLGCGSGANSSNMGAANQPPIDDTRGGMVAPSVPVSSGAPARQGMSTKKKLVLLAGAAALYYLYRKHQANNAAGSTTQNGEPIYYLSKNGRVYYRDADHRAHWVTPPREGIQVPYDEAQRYQGLDRFQGYDGSQSGYTDLTQYATPSGGM